MQVYAVIDTNKDGIADSVVTVVNNLAAPMGLAYANGSLWVATTPTIYRFDNVDELALAGQVKHCCIATIFTVLLPNLSDQPGDRSVHSSQVAHV